MAPLTQFTMIYLIMNIVTAATCLVLSGLMIRFVQKRPDIFIHPWTVWPFVVCVILTAVDHGIRTAAIFTNMKLVLLVVDSIFAMSCVMALGSAVYVYLELKYFPGLKALKEANTALASKLGELSERVGG